MTYGIKYRCTFDPVSSLTSSSAIFALEIFEKGYSGELFTIKGSTIPVLHQWETDDPKAPIKGSSLTMNFINEGNLPLTDFYSTDDDAFKVEFKCLGQMLFTGFIVQDDSSEVLVDFTHEISLSANDNLGLLKDVSLDKANIFSYVFSETTSIPFSVDFHLREFIFLPDVLTHIILGDKIEINGGTPVDGQYTINKIIDGGTAIGVWVDEPVPVTYGGTTTYSILRGSNLLDKTFLSTILNMCLSVTSLNLNTDIYGKIIEVSQDPNFSFLSQTLINPQTFLKSDTEYMNCYDILEWIMRRFRMSLSQSLGVWNIIRWDEARYYNNLIEGFRYDSEFNFVAKITKGAPIESGIGTNVIPETGLLRKINRPLLYFKETFNYQYPKQLLRNYDLKQLGTQIRYYTTGSGINLQKVYEYEAPWWYPSTLGMSVAGNYFIRITQDALGNEIDRVLIVNGDTKSYTIEVNKGDSFKLSFSFKTQDSQPGSINIVSIVELNDGVTQKFFHNPALTSGSNMWQSGVGFTYQIPSGENSNQWHTVEIDSSYYPFPYDGLLYVYLRVEDLSGTKNETYYKDIRFEYSTRINESTKIIGQTHESTQPGTIKNVEEIDIYLDSSPRNAISGTLFLNEKVGVLQKRTSKWMHPYLPASDNLGKIITFEELFWRSKSRTILEATLYGAINTGAYISLLSIIRYNYLSNLNFVFGQLEIDYKNNKLNGTLWEIWADEELDSDLAYGYNFDYLYSTK